MKPPVCHICRKDLGPEDGGLVYFRKTSSDHEWDRRMQEKGMVGHPPYAAWFCGKHCSAAEKYSDYTLPEAVKLIRQSDADEN